VVVVVVVVAAVVDTSPAVADVAVAVVPPTYEVRKIPGTAGRGPRD
jgi:hypothetical protein